MTTTIFRISALAFFLVSLLLLCPKAEAITLDIDNDTIFLGQPVEATLTGIFTFVATPTTLAELRLDFGDGSPLERRTGISGGTPGVAVSLVRTHLYQQPGVYTIIGTGIPGDVGITPPLRVEKTVTVVDPIEADLPRGTVGEKYQYTLVSTTGIKDYRYRLFRGKLPAGIELDRYGRFTGIPEEKGNFKFQVQVTTPSGFSFTRDLLLIVDPGRLEVRVSPDSIVITRGGASTQRVTFEVVYPTVQIQETIRSGRGEFVIGGTVVGYNNVPLAINLNQPNPTAVETIRVPKNVLQTAQNVGINRIIYRRQFQPINLRPAAGETRVSIRTAAAGELRITRLRLYFEQNNRPIITVERGESELTGALEVHYNGSGRFRGYWEVDGRILQRVQMNVFYGTVMTLTTPEIPPLPTFSEGAHRLRFVITEPVAAQKIDFPEAFYHVEAKRAVRVVPISLLSPENNDELSTREPSFSWSEAVAAATYVIDFFSDDADEPFFSAYTNSTSYTLHERLLKLRFSGDQRYGWQVRGFNQDGELCAESPRHYFSLAIQAAFVPGQLIFLVDDSPAGRALIPEIAAKYGLRIIDQNELQVLGKIMVTCSTEAEIEPLLQALRQESGLSQVQPNYIFSTLQQQDDPQRSLQQIDKLLDLDRLHQQLTGKGILVAIIDTGVDFEHRDLSAAIEDHRNFVAAGDYSAEIHGTGVAGIIASQRNDFGILGIAPDSRLLALRACRQIGRSGIAGECVSADIARAIDAAVSLGADIANLSLGSSTEDPLIAEIISAGSRAGLLFTAPVGNDPRAEAMEFPASHPHVIAVAGFDENGRPLPNSIVAAGADTAAPAKSIFSTIPANRHNFLDGTSFSTAAVSGLLALSLENGKRPALGNSLPRFDTIAAWQQEVGRFFGIAP